MSSESQALFSTLTATVTRLDATVARLEATVAEVKLETTRLESEKDVVRRAHKRLDIVDQQIADLLHISAKAGLPERIERHGERIDQMDNWRAEQKPTLARVATNADEIKALRDFQKYALGAVAVASFVGSGLMALIWRAVSAAMGAP